MDLLVSTKSCKFEHWVKYKQLFKLFNIIQLLNIIQIYIANALRMFSIPYLHDSIFKILPC